MICPACGFANEDGVSFCEKCKADLEMPAAPTASEPAPLNDQVESTPAAPSEEPIPLEPIALEPVEEPAASTPPESQASDATPIVDEKTPPIPPPLPIKTTEEAATDISTAPVSVAPVTSPKLIVVRGQRMDVAYPIFPGKNYLGRMDEKPVDIDLVDQESQDRIWTSRQHAVITFEDGKLTIEDLNSLNGTFVNRSRVHPGQVKDLQPNDVVQVGTVHLKVSIG